MRCCSLTLPHEIIEGRRTKKKISQFLLLLLPLCPSALFERCLIISLFYGRRALLCQTLPLLGGKGIITVDHAAAGTTVALYDLSGRKVATQTSAGSRITFNVKPGLYIVSTGGAARKVNAF